MEDIERAIVEFVDEYERRFHERPDPFRLRQDNANFADAFFQLVSGPSLSLDVRVMLWRLFQGCEVKTIALRYDRDAAFDLEILLVGADGVATEPYHGNSIWDFRVLRHLGILAVDHAPVFDGVYAHATE